MKKLLFLILSALLALNVAGCGGGAEKKQESKPAPKQENKQAAPAKADGKKILVAYFSHTGENYGVGVIKKGNTAILAEAIAKEKDAALFEIKEVKPYPEGYQACVDQAKEEQVKKARPAIKETVKNLADYDVIFLGFPNWWGDMPMPVYTFLEQTGSFAGKTIIPFCTHEGSGAVDQAGLKSIATCKDAKILPTFAMKGTKAQKEQAAAVKEIQEWLKTVKY